MDSEDIIIDNLDSKGKFERKEFHDPYQWEFTKELEQNWEIIRKEFDNLQDSLFHPWPEQNLYLQDGKKGQGWDVFGIYAFGKKHFRNSKLCPETTRIVEKIPGLSTAAFSILNPKSKIIPHVGYYGYSEMVLRCHLGVHCPAPELCFLSVGNLKQSWYEGKTLVFDDTFVHSATNDSDITRVILLLDFGTGIPLPNVEKNPSEDTIDQRGYLDEITTLYGYGVKEGEEEQQ